jgi:hypothetical protein
MTTLNSPYQISVRAAISELPHTKFTAWTEFRSHHKITRRHPFEQIALNFKSRKVEMLLLPPQVEHGEAEGKKARNTIEQFGTFRDASYHCPGRRAPSRERSGDSWSGTKGPEHALVL